MNERMNMFRFFYASNLCVTHILNIDSKWTKNRLNITIKGLRSQLYRKYRNTLNENRSIEFGFIKKIHFPRKC